MGIFPSYFMKPEKSSCQPVKERKSQVVTFSNSGMKITYESQENTCNRIRIPYEFQYMTMFCYRMSLNFNINYILK